MSSGGAGLRGAAAVVGVGASPRYRRGASPVGERALALEAIVAACADAGIDPRDVDGFASYGADANEPQALLASLGTRELRWSSLVWGGGGGGIAGAVGAGAAAIATGQAATVVVYRALAQADSGRLADAVSRGHFPELYRANGVCQPAQVCALRTRRLLELVPPSCLLAVVQACYHHAERNPDAAGYGRVVDQATYDAARWVAEPLRLFDSSRENDGAAAVVLTAADRARDLVAQPVYLLGATQGAAAGWGDRLENEEPYWSAGFATVARRLYEQTGVGPGDVDVVQVYENFSGPAVAALMEHGFATPESAAEVFRLENLIAPSGALPINTAGGNLAEGFVHGMHLVLEAVRVLQGRSPNPVPDARICLLTGGPMAPLVSSALFGLDP
jgi:acetyl-CoA acetyltransferase